MDIKPLIRKEVAELKAYEVEDFTGIRVKLDAMENPYILPEALREELARELAAVLVNRYPDPGAGALKEMLGEYIGAPSASLVLGNGSDELIGMIIQAFGGSPGVVAFPVPTFSMYGIIARGLGQETLELPLTSGFELDFDGTLALMMKKRPSVVFISYPNNPTGNLFDMSKLKRLIEGTFAVVVIDEAYFSFSGATFIDMISEYPNLAVLRTLSKVGMAGLRVGVMAAGKDITGAVNKVRLPYNINSLSQASARFLLRHKDVVDQQVSLIIRERDRLHKELSGIDGVQTYPSKTNFILFKVGDAGKVFGGLKGRGILIRNMDSPGPLSGCLRVTVGTPDENTEFLKELKQLL